MEASISTLARCSFAKLQILKKMILQITKSTSHPRWVWHLSGQEKINMICLLSYFVYIFAVLAKKLAQEFLYAKYALLLLICTPRPEFFDYSLIIIIIICVYMISVCKNVYVYAVLFRVGFFLPLWPIGIELRPKGWHGKHFCLLSHRFLPQDISVALSGLELAMHIRLASAHRTVPASALWVLVLKACPTTPSLRIDFEYYLCHNYEHKEK